MPTIEDAEFGTITVRKVSRSSSMRASVAPNGSLRVSVPSFAPMFMVKRMIAGSREELRRLVSSHPVIEIRDGQAVGKSHTLLLRHAETTSVQRRGQQIFVSIGPESSVHDPQVVKEVRAQVIAALRKEAKHHLPRRIKHLADTHGFKFSALRFTHASSRWGSCNSNKAISLNIALMSLPFELIDYVLIHELAHTVELNHSKAFWSQVALAEPDFKRLRLQLKKHNPAI